MLGYRTADHEVRFERWRPPAGWLMVVVALTVGICLGTGLGLARPRSLPARYEYHISEWEARTLLHSAFGAIGIGPDPAPADAEASIRAYFHLTGEIRTIESSPNPDQAAIRALRDERSLHENDVEKTIERWIGEAVETSGLERRLPLFRDIELTWPPVDLELTRPPVLLVRSPRATIARKGDTLLQNDLTLSEIERIEASVDDEDTVSVIVAVGGIAAYPAIVRDDRSYDSLIETSAHEWVHHYLAFFPLGRQWGNGGDAEVLNETTADLAGVELARLIREQHPLVFQPGRDGRPANGGSPQTVDFAAEMRSLRVAVDGLLAAGKVGEAEALMEERRRYLADNGVTIRKINQAYFAFYGTYAESPASSNPIGPKVRRVFAAAGNVGDFLALMREVRTAGDLDDLLRRLGETP